MRSVERNWKLKKIRMNQLLPIDRKGAICYIRLQIKYFNSSDEKEDVKKLIWFREPGGVETGTDLLTRRFGAEQFQVDPSGSNRVEPRETLVPEWIRVSFFYLKWRAYESVSEIT